LEYILVEFEYDFAKEWKGPWFWRAKCRRDQREGKASSFHFQYPITLKSSSVLCKALSEA
jgi:hypothetical protein